MKADDQKLNNQIQEFLSNEKLPLLSPDLDPKGLADMERIQKLAIQKLLEEQDVELVSIREHARKGFLINGFNTLMSILVESELLELTRLEQKQRLFEDEATADWLEERRLELSSLLGSFIKKEKEREQMSAELLIKMDQQKEQDQSMFWLVQFQRLLQEKPISLRRMEAELEPDVSRLLQRACVGPGVIEAFATHRISYNQLCTMTPDDLDKIGVKSSGDKGICHLHKFNMFTRTIFTIIRYIRIQDVRRIFLIFSLKILDFSLIFNPKSYFD